MDDQRFQQIMSAISNSKPMGGEDFNPNSLDACIARIQADIRQILEIQKGLTPRIDALEKFRWYLMGAAAAVTFFFNAAWEWIKAHVK
jgi:hypothetical protein